MVSERELIMETTTKNEAINFSDVEESCLLTFYCHVQENRRADPILEDPLALEIASRIDPLLAASNSKLQKLIAGGKLLEPLVVHICLRAQRYDEYARDFLVRHPDGAIVNIGCGIDTRFDRVDNGRAQFFDLDLPAVIAFKKKLVNETPRYQMIASSVFDHAWMDKVKAGQPENVLFLAEGVFMYCEPDQVKALVLELQRQFPGSELICEVFNKKWLNPFMQKMIKIKLQSQYMMSRDTMFKFGIAESREMESWHEGITLLDDWSYFDSAHPRLGAMRLLGKSKAMQRAQWTVHYRLK